MYVGKTLFAQVMEAGAFYVMDRGYLDFARLYALHQAGAFFVTRAKSPMDARRVYSGTTDRTTGVLCDQRVMLNGYYSAKKYPEHLGRIRFKDPESGKPQGVIGDDQPDAGDGQAGRPGGTERFVVPRKPGNAGGGNVPQFKAGAGSGDAQEIGVTLRNSGSMREPGDLHVRFD